MRFNSKGITEILSEHICPTILGMVNGLTTVELTTGVYTFLTLHLQFVV